MIDVRSFASELATRYGGRVVEVEASDLETSLAIELPGGRVPALIRGYRRAFGVWVPGRLGHLDAPRASGADLLARAERAIRTFVDSTAESESTLIELALRVRERLDAEFGERFSVGFPGVAEPSEVWLHPSDHDTASVGVFPGRLIVWVDSEAHEARVPARDALAPALDAVVRGVALQRERYREHVAASAEVVALGQRLVERLGAALGRSFESVLEFRPTHSGATRARLVERGTRRAVAEVRAQRTDVSVELVPGASAPIASTAIDADFERFAESVRRSLDRLSLDGLVRGARYRVRDAIGGLLPGVCVTFLGFEDVDNHYGAYRFRAVDGAEVSVTGDFSAPHRHAFYATDRYLEPVG